MSKCLFPAKNIFLSGIDVIPKSPPSIVFSLECTRYFYSQVHALHIISITFLILYIIYIIYITGVWVWDFSEGRTRGETGEQDEGDQSDAEQPEQDNIPHCSRYEDDWTEAKCQAQDPWKERREEGVKTRRTWECS